MSPRERVLLRAVIGVVAVLLLVVWASSYHGRVTLVDTLREGCERGAKNAVAVINDTRADQLAKRAISMDPKQSPQTRAALRSASKIEDSELQGYDERIVVSVVELVRDPRDKARVMAIGLTCSDLYPSPSLIDF